MDRLIPWSFFNTVALLHCCTVALLHQELGQLKSPVWAKWLSTCSVTLYLVHAGTRLGRSSWVYQCIACIISFGARSVDGHLTSLLNCITKLHCFLGFGRVCSSLHPSKASVCISITVFHIPDDAKQSLTEHTCIPAEDKAVRRCIAIFPTYSFEFCIALTTSVETIPSLSRNHMLSQRREVVSDFRQYMHQQYCIFTLFIQIQKLRWLLAYCMSSSG